MRPICVAPQPLPTDLSMPRLRLEIDYARPVWTGRSVLGRLLRQAARKTFAPPHVLPDDLPNPDCTEVVIALRLTDDAEMRALNHQFRQIDKATNVLSFPSSDHEAMAESSFLGDIAIGFETVQREAVRDEKQFSDHLAHLLVHGCLHLIGYDHQDRAEAEAMEAKEIAILADLGLANPYADFDLVETMQQGA